jgi:NitT/TauT family transport system permease protein
VGSPFIWDFLPPPTASLAALWALVVRPPYPEYNVVQQAGITLARFLAAYALGIAIAVPVGLALGWWRRLHDAFVPILEFLRPTPTLILYPLVLLLVGMGNASTILTSAITVFSIVVINSIYGAGSADRVLIDSLRTLGATRGQIFRKAVVFAALPLVAAGCRLVVGTAFLVVIAVEMLEGQTGLGFLIYFSMEKLEYDVMFAAILVTLVLGAAGSYLWQAAESRLLRWHYDLSARA